MSFKIICNNCGAEQEFKENQPMNDDDSYNIEVFPHSGGMVAIGCKKCKQLINE